MFLDLDELLILNNHSIKETLGCHPQADSISYHWMIYYGTRGAFKDRPMSERFRLAALNHPKKVLA